MKIKIGQFCSLATSQSFQLWLYNYSQDLYREFISKLHESHGCSYNKELMKELLNTIQKMGGDNNIAEFLVKNYPNMIEGYTSDVADHDDSDIFDHYSPGVLTYPRRIIFVGTKKELQKRVREFVLDKIKSDYIIIGDKAYVEYLEKDDKSLLDQIPLRNWKIAAYRQK